MARTTFLLLTALLLTSCSLELLEPGPSTDGLPDGLEISLAVTPDDVSQHAPFTVRFTATNTTDESMQIVTNHGCLVIPGVYRNGERLPFAGSWWGCTAAITTHTFLPGETKSFEWNMRAEVYAEHEGEVEGAPAPAGTYAVRVEFDVEPVAGSNRKPGAEETLRVR